MEQRFFSIHRMMKWIVVIYWISKRWQTLCVECSSACALGCHSIFTIQKQLDSFYWTNAKVAIKSTHTSSKYFAEICNHFWIIIFRCCRCCFQWHEEKIGWILFLSFAHFKMLNQILSTACIHAVWQSSISPSSCLPLSNVFNMNINILVAFNSNAPKKIVFIRWGIVCCVFFVQNLAFTNAWLLQNNRTIKIPSWTKRRLSKWNNQARKKRKKIDGKHFINARSILSVLSLHRWCISHNRMWHGEIIGRCVTVLPFRGFVNHKFNAVFFFLACTLCPEIGCDGSNVFSLINIIRKVHQKWRCGKKVFILQIIGIHPNCDINI